MVVRRLAECPWKENRDPCSKGLHPYGERWAVVNVNQGIRLHGRVLAGRCAVQWGGKNSGLGLERCFQVLSLLAPVTLTGVTLMGRVP